MATNVRRTTIVEVLDMALELERKTMALYAGFVRLFANDPEIRQFWFNMARTEAAHCGGLMLVESILRDDPELSQEARIRFDMTTGVRLRSLLAAYRRELRRGISLERALEMAVDLEGSELEDVVVDLLQVVRDPGWRDQAVKMLVHDMGDMSYMIERHTRNSKLLARADALVEKRIARPKAARGSAPGGPKTRAKKKRRATA
ncbi:MAG: hypothetical protein FJ144_23650 [Deltaproteobacteria bacterium]|nr:hypothetical protein [Deltaproteobacteria bacterium]